MSRIISTLLFVPILASVHCPANGQERDAPYVRLTKEIEVTWNRPAFAELRAKTALWDREITSRMTTDATIATETEQLALLKWAEQLARIGPQMIRVVQSMCSESVAPAVGNLMERYQKREIDLTVSLSRGLLTWGRYNSERIASAGEQFKEYQQFSNSCTTPGKRQTPKSGNADFLRFGRVLTVRNWFVAANAKSWNEMPNPSLNRTPLGGAYAPSFGSPVSLLR
jgi:hypothetical protein